MEYAKTPGPQSTHENGIPETNRATGSVRRKIIPDGKVASKVFQTVYVTQLPLHLNANKRQVVHQQKNDNQNNPLLGHTFT